MVKIITEKKAGPTSPGAKIAAPVKKLVITIDQGNPRIFGHKYGKFLWNEHHKLYLYDGREYPVDENFNKVCELAFKEYRRLKFITVRVVDAAPVVVGEPKASEKPASKIVRVLHDPLYQTG